MQESSHFEDMLRERGIKHQWVDRAVQSPDMVEDQDDGTRHFIKQIPEFGNRWLRVIVNVTVSPEKRVTAFFNRRLRKQNENQG